MDEDVSKKNAGELAEEIDAMGQESEEKAVKWVKEVEDREEKKRNAAEAQSEEIIAKKRRFKKNDYYEAIYQEARRKIAEYDINPGYQVDVVLNGDKLVFGLRKVGYRWYAKGMRICGEPKYDRNCVQRMIVQLFIALDELGNEHDRHRTASGIILPNRQ